MQAKLALKSSTTFIKHCANEAGIRFEILSRALKFKTLSVI